LGLGVAARSSVCFPQIGPKSGVTAGKNWKMNVWQVVITRFSYRAPGSAAGNDWQSDTDPLEPNRLAFRHAVFDLACAPSLLAQTNQDFDWVLIIDEAIPDAHRHRLNELVGRRERTHLHTFSADQDLSTLGWLRPYAPYDFDDIDYIVTTLLDDDDALPNDFVATLRARLEHGADTLPLVFFFGVKQTLLWDLITSSRHPLGTANNWHRGNWPQSAGFSIACRQPDYDGCVLAFDHALAEIYGLNLRGEKLQTAFHEKTGGRRSPAFLDAEMDNYDRMFDDPFRKNNVDRNALAETECFHDLSENLQVSAVMVNHFCNDQATRLFNKKPGRHAVTGPETFPGVTINWDLLESNSSRFRKNLDAYRQLLQSTSSPLEWLKLTRLFFAA
jgi:hypothetical protein